MIWMQKKSFWTAEKDSVYASDLCVGSECFIPPMEGHGLPEVVAIRRLSDVEKVESLMQTAEMQW